MSRFQLLQATTAVVAGSPQHRRLNAGTKIADTAGNAQPGDVVSATLCAPANAVAAAILNPLDGAAVTVLAGVGLTRSIGGPVVGPTGAASIDA
jgi:hypothetical protein